MCFIKPNICDGGKSANGSKWKKKLIRYYKTWNFRLKGEWCKHRRVNGYVKIGRSTFHDILSSETKIPERSVSQNNMNLHYSYMARAQ